jgi:hypothetical protein
VLIAGLSTGHKIGLGLVALAFILFALTSSFLLPRLRRGFPGQAGVGGFVALTVLFFCAMIAAVWFFGQEPKEHQARAAAPATTQAAPPPPATTHAATTAAAPPPPAPTTTAAAPAPAAPKGDPAAGKQLFTANGCSACHTYKPAGATGKIGPDLDKLPADAKKANRGPLDQYVAESITNPDAYIVPGYPKGVMPKTFASLGKTKIADLVAFLTQS